MALYLVRHGQTDWNVARRFQSRTDVQLNATGIWQAEQVRDWLAGHGVQFARAYTSPRARAVHTAQILLAASGSVAALEPALAELDLGDYEGRLEQELRLAQGVQYDHWRATHFRIAAPGGESLADVMARIRGSLARWTPAARATDVLVVGHQGVNMAIKAVLAGCEPEPDVAVFGQANDEIDIWDVDTGRRLELISVADP